MKTTTHAVPQVSLAVAEKTLRDIARRNGNIIRKRRSRILKAQFGDGYAIIDGQRNVLLSGHRTNDGCDESLASVAKWFEDDRENTPWQRIVISAILQGKVFNE